MTTPAISETLVIREFEPTEGDYQAITEIDNEVLPEYPSTVEEVEHRDKNWDASKYFRRRYIAEDPLTGRVVGWTEYRHRVYFFHPDRYRLWIAVRPAEQHKGIGSRLLEAAEKELVERGAENVGTSAGEKLPESIDFLVKRGFYEVSREWESRINPQDFDPEPFQKYLSRAADAGIEITTLAELRKTDPDWRNQIYALHMAAEADAPTPWQLTPPPIDEFIANEVESPGVIDEAYFVARQGGQYVALSFLLKDLAQENSLYQGLTGVRREYRGRGLAMAVKVKVLEYARSHGYTKMRTWNSTLNEGMLAINGKLGFIRQPAWIDYEKKLVSP